MPAGVNYAPIRGRRMRVTRLDECGVPVVGPATTRVSKGFVSAQMSPQYEDTEAISVKDASGDLDVNEPSDSYLMSMQTAIQFTRVDPDLFALITGQQLVLDADGKGVGFRLAGGIAFGSSWALEVWSDIGGAACAGVKPYGYSLLPFLRGGKVGDFTHEDGAASFTITSNTRENSGWGTGPYNVVHTATGNTVPGKLLTAIGPREHYHQQLTTVAPPAVTAGLVALP